VGRAAGRSQFAARDSRGLPEALARYDERGQFGAWIGRVTTRVALMRQRPVRQRGDVSLVDIT